MIRDLNQRLKDKTGVDVDLVRHGPHDCWPQRMIREVAKSNYGAQVEDGVKALSVYMKTPDGPQVRSVSNLEELKEIYLSLNIDWDSVYGEENWDPDFCKEVGRYKPSYHQGAMRDAVVAQMRELESRSTEVKGAEGRRLLKDYLMH